MDPESAEAIRSIRRSAAGGFRLAFREIYGIETPEARRHGEELAEFGLALADGAFIAHQVDASTDLRRLFDFVADAFLAIGDRMASDGAADASDASDGGAGGDGAPPRAGRALVGDRA
jgi:hypothetical protein